MPVSAKCKKKDAEKKEEPKMDLKRGKQDQGLAENKARGDNVLSTQRAKDLSGGLNPVKRNA